VDVEVQKVRNHRIVTEVALDARNLPLSRRQRLLEAQVPNDLSELGPRLMSDQEVDVPPAGHPTVRGPVTLPLTIGHTLGIERPGETFEEARVRLSGAGAMALEH
jgi:hypothetical protein